MCSHKSSNILCHSRFVNNKAVRGDAGGGFCFVDSTIIVFIVLENAAFLKSDRRKFPSWLHQRDLQLYPRANEANECRSVLGEVLKVPP